MTRKVVIPETGCGHKGCKNLHKNSSGFCVDHAPDIDKQVMQEPQDRAMPVKDRDFYGTMDSDY